MFFFIDFFQSVIERGSLSIPLSFVFILTEVKNDILVQHIMKIFSKAPYRKVQMLTFFTDKYAQIKTYNIEIKRRLY